MSNYGNRNSKMPDTSPKPRQDFSVRDRTIAIMLVAAFVAIIALGIGAFVTHDTESVKKALAEVEQQKADQLANYKTKMAELGTREQELDTRKLGLDKTESGLQAREDDLQSREDALMTATEELATEKTEFFNAQLRVYELSKSLYEELTLYAPDSSTAKE